MRILVTGATGFIGSRVCAMLAAAGYEVTAVSRDGESAKRRLPMLTAAHSWQPLDGPAPAEAFDGVDAVVNLMGESVSGRWTAAKKDRIHRSRVTGTRNLVAGMRELQQRPALLVNQSAWGYYGDRGDDVLTEEEPPGGIFLSGVCADWEAAAVEAEALGVRVVRMRTSLVVGPGGFLSPMTPLFKFGLGGPLGSGKQWWSWIHRDDLARFVIHAIEREDVTGPVNLATPGHLRQRDFAKTLGSVLRRPAIIPAPAFAVRLILGEFSTEVLTSKRLAPKAALESNFAFTFPILDAALRDAYEQTWE
ncbi:MAG: TIGR01777 family oxidoreductase [Dehalococcoidia bacterium]